VRMLNTIDDNSIYNTLSTICGVKEDVIQYYIYRNMFRIAKYGSVSQIDVNDFIRYLSPFNNSKTIEFNEITIAHLT